MHHDDTGAPRTHSRDTAGPATRRDIRVRARARQIRWAAAVLVVVVVAGLPSARTPAPDLTWSVAYGGPGSDPWHGDFKAYGIECGSAARCWVPGATGHPGEGSVQDFDTQVQLRLNGSTWSTGRHDDFPQQMRCLSADNCWGVDSRLLPGKWEHYDGRRWSVEAEFGVGVGFLRRFDCADATHCWAIGSDTGRDLIAVWSGGAWREVENAVAPRELLWDITCPVVDECWTIGWKESVPFVVHLRDGRWSRIPVPQPPGDKTTDDRLVGSFLGSVTCAADQCWVIGYAETESGMSSAVTYHPFLVRFDGSTPVLVPSPLPWPGTMSCPEIDDCWMTSGVEMTQDVDEYGCCPGIAPPAVAHWDGTAWTVTNLVNPYHGLYDQIEGIDCPTPTVCWIVGAAYTSRKFDGHAAPVIYRGTATRD